MPIAYEEVKDGEMIKWDKIGTKIEGVLRSRNEVASTKSKTGKAIIFEVQTKTGLVSFFATTDLRKKLDGVPMHSIVIIEFKEEVKTASNDTFKKFAVSFAKGTKENLSAIGIEIMTDVMDENPDNAKVDFN